MIWHAFLLNPSDYLDYCRNQYWDYLPRVNFPWKLIVRLYPGMSPTPLHELIAI